MSDEWNAALEGAATIIEGTQYANRNAIGAIIRKMKRPSIGRPPTGGIPMPPPNSHQVSDAGIETEAALSRKEK